MASDATRVHVSQNKHVYRLPVCRHCYNSIMGGGLTARSVIICTTSKICLKYHWSFICPSCFFQKKHYHNIITKYQTLERLCSVHNCCQHWCTRGSLQPAAVSIDIHLDHFNQFLRLKMGGYELFQVFGWPRLYSTAVWFTDSNGQQDCAGSTQWSGEHPETGRTRCQDAWRYQSLCRHDRGMLRCVETGYISRCIYMHTWYCYTQFVFTPGPIYQNLLPLKADLSLDPEFSWSAGPRPCGHLTRDSSCCVSCVLSKYTVVQPLHSLHYGTTAQMRAMRCLLLLSPSPQIFLLYNYNTWWEHPFLILVCLLPVFCICYISLPSIILTCLSSDVWC